MQNVNTDGKNYIDLDKDLLKLELKGQNIVLNDKQEKVVKDVVAKKVEEHIEAKV